LDYYRKDIDGASQVYSAYALSQLFTDESGSVKSRATQALTEIYLDKGLYMSPEPVDVIKSSEVSGPAKGHNNSDDDTSLSLTDLGMVRNALWTEYQADTEANFPLDVVELDEKILAQCPLGHPGRADACERLSTSLRMRAQTVIVDTLSATVDNDSFPSTDLDMIRMARGAISNHYQETRDLGALEQMIELDEQILNMCAVGDLLRASACSNLATSLRLRTHDNNNDSEMNPMSYGTLATVTQSLWMGYTESRDLELLGQVIAGAVAMLESVPKGDPKRVSACMILANALSEEHARTGDANMLREAVLVYGEAYALSSAIGHKRQADIQSDYATSLYKLSVHTGDAILLGKATELGYGALTSGHYGHLDRVASCINRAISLKMRYEETGVATLLSEAIELEREALAIYPPGHPERAIPCGNLAVSLKTRHNETHDVTVLIEATQLDREALLLRPPGHPNRDTSCFNLALSLVRCYNQPEISNLSLLIEAIELQHEALALRPPGHPDRATTCTGLANALGTRYDRMGDIGLLNKAIELEREALALHPPGHSDRATSCSHLASHLTKRYTQMGDVSLLIEAIQLGREALALKSHNQITHAGSYTNLAHSLHELYDQTSDSSLLGEAIELDRKALALRPLGHRDRAESCSSLAIALKRQYDHTGDASLLDEAVELDREALALSPLGHRDRARSFSNLAVTLQMRFHESGDTSLLREITELQRETLTLRPPGHPNRALSCANLATSLRLCYIQTLPAGDVSLLDRAIELMREALALRPLGHPDRGQSCSNLAAALSTSKMCDASMLGEVVKLQREALVLHAPGHSDRSHSCIGLAISLTKLYEQTGDTSLLKEATDLSQEAYDCAPTSELWRTLSVRCDCYLSQPASYDLAVPLILQCLLEWSQSEAGDIGASMMNICLKLVRFWNLSADWTDDVLPALASIYSNTIDKLPLVACFVLDTSSRLNALRLFKQLGSQACIVALKAQRLPQAIELLDHAHGVIWAQALHQRDPQLGGLPPALASDLEGLLRAVSAPSVQEPANRYLTSRDVRHEQNRRIQTLLGQIRAMPGLERFMRGNTFETLRRVARDHPVVVLVTLGSESYAVIVSSSSQEEPDVVNLEVTSQRIVQLRGRTQRAGFRMRGSTEHDWTDAWIEPVEDELDRLMRPAGQLHSLTGVLGELWKAVVKPVIAHLGFEVSTFGEGYRNASWN
jgi:hypothetical protein